MKKIFSEKIYHLLFEAGVIIKGIIALGEVILGILFYSVSTPALNSAFLFFLGDEGSEQPRDFIWNYFIHSYQGLIGSNQSFWAFLFLSHGLIKLLLAWALLKNKLWAYPSAAVVFTLFVIYQLYSIISMPSLFLELFTAFDVVVIALILHKYKHKKRLLAKQLL